MKSSIIILFVFAFANSYAQNDYVLKSRDYPIIDVAINGVNAAMIIDTGADVNIIDTECAKRFKVDVVPTLGVTIGSSKNFDVHDTKGLLCMVKGRPVTKFIASNISYVFNPIHERTGIKISGILGTPAIKELGMIIDLSRGIVTIKADIGK